ncbi:hypothetical protein HA402_016127 [Bradysia odoriphaga]|nr:hypothetical protein HA402_016127 [Bradysia odoriphaga]
MVKTFSYLWLSLMIVAGAITDIHCFGAKLSMNIQQSGFHRTVKYITVFTDPPEKPCDFHLRQAVPSSAYVSVDQLDDLRRFDRIEYYIESDVDVEGITSKSSPFNIYLYGDTASLFVIYLPLHLRYHSPGHSSFVKVSLDHPELFVDCHGHTPHNTTTDDSVLDLKCRKSNGNCKWLKIDYESHSEPVTMSVPIGYLDFSTLVTGVTILVSWIGSYYIARAISRKAAALKNRL